MSSPTVERRDAEADRRMEAWVDAGIITADQRDAIVAFEARARDEAAPAPRLTLVAEVATYLGSVIAFAGGAAIIGPNWSDLGLGARLVIAAAIALVGFVGGGALMGVGEPGTDRLGAFLWVVATGGVALGVGVTVHDLDTREPANVALAVGVAVAALGIALWRNLDRPLQLLTGVVGVMIMWSAIDQIVGWSPWLFGASVWAASMSFGVVAAAGRVRPRSTALVAAAVGAMFGAFSFGEAEEGFASWIAVATAGLIVAYALVDRSWGLVAVGLLAFVAATTMLMSTVLEGLAARLVAVLIGLVVVAVVAVRAQRGRG